MTHPAETLRPAVRHEYQMRELRRLKRRADVQDWMLVGIICIQLINLAKAFSR